MWFSRYWPYSEQDYHTLLAQFRANRVPLDTLSIDTDFKRESDPAVAPIYAAIAGAPGQPYAWDGWEWDTKLFPDPQRFIDWAHSQGLSLTLNIHPLDLQRRPAVVGDRVGIRRTRTISNRTLSRI